MKQEEQHGKKWPLRSYVLRAARMSTLQRNSYNELLPLYSVQYRESDVSLKEIFPFASRYMVEIGFGMGEATVTLAKNNPDTGYLGIEVHKPGVGKVLSEIDHLSLNNLRIVNHDAVEVFQHMIPPNSINGIHIFFPDPWPKKKHHKRRLIQLPFVNLIVPKLVAGGYLYICTDWEEYAQQILAVCSNADGIANSCNGFAQPQSWRPQTKFESKGIDKAHRIREVYFTKTT
ncbi:tRNA (guanosine(46)-N7)-methyltransferase TrmB [Marispirochaeta sp.]|uniref:tRNA (guanosine(46)-N7)-methyltransferase TrmB n=1 Tax=Marispirochaeta sp. TaxID=2038653 RepID=UPI0029C84910|nr:tRNA (guanosine(46)-N7)-methyltransferase TrmB [Marispirochaeta sp.]